MADLSTIVTSTAELVEKLFGRLGVAAFLACLIFFLMPSHWLAAVGVDNHDPILRKYAGILLILSVTTTTISLVVVLKPIWVALAEMGIVNLSYHRIPIEARVFLGIYSHNQAQSITVDRNSEAIQSLIDAGYIANVSAAPRFSITLTQKGAAFVRAFRKELRHTAMKNRHLQDKVADMLKTAAKAVPNTRI